MSQSARKKNIILRIGSTEGFVHGKTQKQTSIEVADGEGGVYTLTDNWTIVRRNAFEDPKKYASVRPMRVNLSRKRPVLELSRKDVPEAVIDKVIEHLTKCAYMFNKNDQEEFDTVTLRPLGKKATMTWWFEDTRLTKKENVSVKRQTLLIGNTVMDKMSGDEKALRDALYLIGETPEEGMTDTELEDLLLEKVMVEHSQERRAFIDAYVSEESSERESEIRVMVKKGVQHKIIDVNEDVYKIGKDRLGIGEDDVVSFFKSKGGEGLYTFLVTQVAAKSEFKEDKGAGDKVVKEVVSKEAAVKADVLWDTLKDLTKLNLGVKNAGLMYSKAETIEKGIELYNNKATKENYEGPKMTLKLLTEKSNGAVTA